MTGDEVQAVIDRLRGIHPTAVAASRAGEPAGRVAYCYGYHQALSDLEREIGPFQRFGPYTNEETSDVDH